MKKIEKPKVFISYAWSSQEYEDQILSFAEKLMQDGIDVVIDKWILEEGNDTYAFMEKSVNDNSITNVLIMLDPVYAKKADERKGGVGAETQIISSEIYNQVSQNKFIPIIFQRDENNRVCKPAYLKNVLYIDLTVAKSFEEEYRRLVMLLYGEKKYKKPSLGSKPKWVEEESLPSTISYAKFNEIKRITNEKERNKFINSLFDELIQNALSIVDDCKDISSDEVYFNLYNQLHNILEEYLLLLNKILIEKECAKIVSNFLENIKNAINRKLNPKFNILHILVHELFIYTIGYLFKEKEYKAIGYILSKTYFIEGESDPQGFSVFHSSREYDRFSGIINSMDKKEYFSGTAKYWISNIFVKFCSKEEFVLGDLLCFNYIYYSPKNPINTWWFPVCYIYDDEYNSVIKKLSIRLLSIEYAQELVLAFSFDKVDVFVDKVKENAPNIDGIMNQYRFWGSFQSPYLIGCFITYDKIGQLK